MSHVINMPVQDLKTDPAHGDPTPGLTRRQRACLAVIADYVAAHRISPSVDDVRIGLGMASKSSTQRLLDRLEERRYIRRLPYRARSIELVGAAERALMLETGMPMTS